MKPRHLMPIAIALALFLLPVAANAADKIKAVASFSILGDMVKEVGGDRVEVTTLVRDVTGARLILNQTVTRDGERLTDAEVTIVLVNREGKARRIPDSVRDTLHAAAVKSGVAAS